MSFNIVCSLIIECNLNSAELVHARCESYDSIFYNQFFMLSVAFRCCILWISITTVVCLPYDYNQLFAVQISYLVRQQL